MDLYSIYPKQFRNSKIPIEKDRCFVLMPFSEKHDMLYGVIKDTLHKLGINCFRDDEIFGPQPFMNKVITEILKSRYLIVILTDYRPNVLYELGIAHCYKDIQNVLILIDKQSELNPSVHMHASDLSHLTYVEYDSSNTAMVRSTIREFVKNNEIAFDFQDFLYERGIISVISENTNDFIIYIKEIFDVHFESFTELLLKRNLEDSQKENLLEICCSALYEQIDANGTYIDIMLKIFAESLIAVKRPDISEKYVKSIINDEMIRKRIISENLKNQWKINFTVYLAKQECFLDVLLPWIINYLGRTTSSSIDLNRYKLEAFLVDTTITKIDEALCNALRDKDFHIREHLSDIIGEKQLTLAYSSLCLAIQNEPNLYAGKSIIVALGKIANRVDPEATEIVLQWLKDNISRILSSGEDFTNSILTKSRVTILKIFPQHLEYFDENFDKYITNKNY